MALNNLGLGFVVADARSRVGEDGAAGEALLEP